MKNLGESFPELIFIGCFEWYNPLSSQPALQIDIDGVDYLQLVHVKLDSATRIIFIWLDFDFRNISIFH